MGGEVLLGPERRRRWSLAEKSALIEESLRPQASVSEIARRHGVSRSLLYNWRREALGTMDAAACPREPAFVPVLLTPPEAAAPPAVPSAVSESRQDGRTGEIEVALPGGARVTLRGAVEPKTLRAVLAALRLDSGA